MSTQTLSPPELETLELEIDGEIGTLTLDRPDAFNAMSPEMILEMTVVFAWLADRSRLRGADRHRRRQGLLLRRRRQHLQGRRRSPRRSTCPPRCGAAPRRCTTAIVDLRRIPFPVIAAVNGPAAGAGFSLALACDTRIASEAAFFACAYGRIGASPDGGMTYFLPRIVGPSRALELLLDDPNMSAAGGARGAAGQRGRRRRRS